MILHLLKIHELACEMTDWAEDSKTVIWTAYVTAIFGSFRFEKLL